MVPVVPAVVHQGLHLLGSLRALGAVLNITCTPLRSRGLGAPPLMLNHVETPHIDIASAVCASSAVPGLIEAVTLKEGARRHAARVSPPRLRLGRPHPRRRRLLRVGPAAARAGRHLWLPVHDRVAGEPARVCFHAWPNGRPGRPSAGRERTGAWRGGFLLGALEVALKEDLRRHLRTVQQLNLSLDLIGIDWTRMWLQADGNYGSVMITRLPPPRLPQPRRQPA